MARIIDGKEISAQVRTELRDRIRELGTRGKTPQLAVVLVGDNPASVSYVTGKARACADIGIDEKDLRLPADTSQEELLALVQELNGDPAVDGILVQLPLPDHIDEHAVIQSISPAKDVDGFHPVSIGSMMLGLPGFLPCTPNGIVQLLTRTGNDPAGRHVVIVGRSNIVGKPLASLLSAKRPGGNATVTVCHSRTPDLGRFTREAEILIAAIGSPQFIKGDMVREGSVVIDVGVNRIPDDSRTRGYRLVGDVDYEAASARAGAITPVPGGVGPMTIAMLLVNTVEAAERHVVG